MPIIQAPIESTTVQPPAPIKISAPEFMGTVVDSKSVPLSSLLTYIEGGSWPVTYYSQVLGADNATSGQDPGQSALYQQYTRIHNFELKVTTSLNSSQNSSGSGSMVITGSAVIYPFLVPNKGDMFVANTADGKEGVFVITNSTRQTMFRESVFSVDYQLYYLTEKDQNRRADLDKKTIKSTFFHKDLLQGGKDPMVIDEDHKALIDLKSLQDQLVRTMYDNFYSKEYQTILVPGQLMPVYDPFVVTIMTRLVNTHQHESALYTRLLNCQDDNALYQNSVYEAIARRDPSMLSTCFRKYCLMSAGMFSQSPMAEGIRYSGIQYVVYPKDAQKGIDHDLNKLDKPTVGLTGLKIPTEGRSGNLDDIVPTEEPGNGGGKINPIGLEDYVFTESFYRNQSNGLCKLEILTLDHIHGRSVDPKKIVELMQDYQNWGRLEQFYYTPILYSLIAGVLGPK